jgi:DNA polymerase III subunit gamma/tau
MSENYQVIARKWRPRNFDELVGQKSIVRTLKNAIESGRIAHAYLFVGPRGTGKTSTARLFAKSLNCENGPSLKPPEDSSICKAIMQGSCMDVIEIDGASNNSVEQIRDLREDCQYAPAQCRFKIYIIDEVHMLTTAAFNALLKILEEPPSHVKFIFATTESHKVLATIVSRCQRLEFRPIEDAIIIDKLNWIAKKEGWQIETLALHSVARLANGGMRDAQSILEQLIAFCGNTITEADVLDVYGLTAHSDIQKASQLMASEAYRETLALVARLADEGKDLHRFLLDLERYLREVLIDVIEGKNTVEKLGVSLTADNMLRMLDTLHKGEDFVRGGLSERVNVEILLLKAIEQSRKRAIDTLIKTLSQSSELPQQFAQKKNPARVRAESTKQTSVVTSAAIKREAFIEITAPLIGGPVVEVEIKELDSTLSSTPQKEPSSSAHFEQKIISENECDAYVFMEDPGTAAYDFEHNTAMSIPSENFAPPGATKMDVLEISKATLSVAEAAAMLSNSTRTLLEEKFRARFVNVIPIPS